MALEIDSFILKFKNLWQAGRNADLSIKSSNGKVEVSLSVQLGDAPPLPARHQLHPSNGPSRQRRRVRRAAAREAAASTEETIDDNNVAEEIITIAVADAPEEEVGDNNNFVAENGDINKGLEPKSKIEDEEYLESTDVYVFHYSDESNKCEAQDALDLIEERLTNNVRRCKIQACDQVYKVEEIKKHEEYDGFQVLLKVKRSRNYMVENAVRTIQVSEGTLRPGLRLNLQRIIR